MDGELEKAKAVIAWLKPEKAYLATRDTGKWSRPDVPHKGWVCTHMLDFEDKTITCHMCEMIEVRYVHVMLHPQTRKEFWVDWVCAGRMEGDAAKAVARREEEVAKSRAMRKAQPEEARREQNAKQKVDIVSVRTTPAFVEKIRANPEGVRVLVRGADGTAFEAPLSVWVQTALCGAEGYEFPETDRPIYSRSEKKVG
jgi:hypothetical protein